MSDERFPVEPLSERRWQAIRRKVLAEATLVESEPARSASRRPIWIGVGLLAAAAAVLVWLVPTRPPPAASAVTARVVTEGSAAVTNAGDATLDLAARTSVLVIERAPDAWLVSLEYGSVHFTVPPRRARPPFTVEAGRTRIEVIGTAFTVTRDPGSASASVSVDHGVVRVLDADTEVLLSAGDSWPRVTTATAVIPSRATEQAVSEPEVRAPVERARAPRAPVASAAPSEPEAVAPAPTPRDRYHEAQSLEATEPARALTLYEGLSSDGGGYAAPALFARARLEDELGHADRARAIAEEYLRRHPDGLNAADARVLLDAR